MKTIAIFAVGDTVRMKSGGHEMTVRGFEKTDSTPVASNHAEAHVRCEWMADDGKMHAHVFSREMLDGVKVDQSADDKSGVRRVLDRQEAGQNSRADFGGLAGRQNPSLQDDPRAIPGGIPQNPVAPPPDHLWNKDDDNRDVGPKANEDKQGRQFNSPAQHQGASGGPGADPH